MRVALGLAAGAAIALAACAGQTPEQTLYAQVLREIAKAERRGQTPRFVRHGRGVIGLSRAAPRGLGSSAP